MRRAQRRPPTSVFFEIFALNQAVRALLETVMEGSPLTPEEYAVYSAVFEAESLTPTQMAERLGMPLTTVMERVRALEERGHAKRVANAADGRSYHLVLTAQGLAAHKRTNERFEVAYRRFIESLDGDESRTHAQLVKLRKAIERAGRGAESRAKGG